MALDGNFQPAGEVQQAEVELFVEVAGNNPDLFIFGASQVAVPVAALASQAGFRVHVVDTRPRFANSERFPSASEILVGFPGEIAGGQTFNQFSFALLLGHAAKHDLPVLEVLLRTDLRYIGVLGGARRAAALAKRLGEIGYSDKQIARVKIPVGLDIGAGDSGADSDSNRRGTADGANRKDAQSDQKPFTLRLGGISRKFSWPFTPIRFWSMRGARGSLAEWLIRMSSSRSLTRCAETEFGSSSGWPMAGRS